MSKVQNMKEFIQITRHPDGEPHYVNLVVLASNGNSSGGLEFYINLEKLTKIAEGLSNFPPHNNAKYLFERGSERPEDRQANYFRLRAFALKNEHGHAIHLTMNNNSDNFDTRFFLPELSEFYIHTSLERIRLLGNLLTQFTKLKEQRLFWSSTEAFLDNESTFEKGQARDNLIDAHNLLPR